VELLSGEQVRSGFPYVSTDVVQARWRAGDGWLDPKRLTAGYALGSGAAFVTGVDVTGIRLERGRATGVQTSRGEVSAGAVVIAAGPFSAQLAATAGVTLPITNVRRMRIVVPEVPEAPPWAPMTIDEETGAHWRPWRDGAHCMWTQSESVPEPPLDDVPPSDRFVFDVLDPASPNSVARLSPFWADVWRRRTQHWFVRAGQYDLTPDHRPLIGALGIPGLFANTGYSGHGVMMSAGGGRLLADVVSGHATAERNPFRPERTFAERERDVL
jgi:sarcosine oxidase subunit beta